QRGEQRDRAPAGQVERRAAQPPLVERPVALHHWGRRLCREVDLEGLDELDRVIDLTCGRRVVEDAEPQREAAAHAARRDEYLAALLDPLREVVVDPLEDGLVVDAGRTAAERDDAQRGGREQLQLRRALDPLLRRKGEVDAPVDRRAEGGY